MRGLGGADSIGIFVAGAGGRVEVGMAMLAAAGGLVVPGAHGGWCLEGGEREECRGVVQVRSGRAARRRVGWGCDWASEERKRSGSAAIDCEDAGTVGFGFGYWAARRRARVAKSKRTKGGCGGAREEQEMVLQCCRRAGAQAGLADTSEDHLRSPGIAPLRKHGDPLRPCSHSFFFHLPRILT